MTAPVVTSAELAQLQRRVADLEQQLAEAEQRNSDLRDSLTSCRAAVEQQQVEHSAYRLLNPPRRAAQ